MWNVIVKTAAASLFDCALDPQTKTIYPLAILCQASSYRFASRMSKKMSTTPEELVYCKKGGGEGVLACCQISLYKKTRLAFVLSMRSPNARR